jgi:hypothetical protein
MTIQEIVLLVEAKTGDSVDSNAELYEMLQKAKNGDS